MNPHDTTRIQQEGRQISEPKESFGSEGECEESYPNEDGETTLDGKFIAYIYFLLDEFGRIRYVGKTTRPPQRLQYHLYTGGKSHKDNWIKSMMSRGLKPIMEVIEEVECECDEDWHEVEMFYICYMRFLGFSLTNIENGGQGPGRITKETRQRMSESRKGKPGRPMTEDQKQALLKTHIGIPRSEETKKKISETNKKTNAIERLKGFPSPAGWNKGIPSSEETKAKQSVAHKAIGTGKYVRTEETKEKTRKALTGRKMTEEERAKLRGPRGPNIRTLRKLGLVPPKSDTQPPQDPCTS